jgi:hypothetical protein
MNSGGKMAKYTTKYFGEITFDETDITFVSTDVKYEGREINISLSDFNIYGDKLKICLEIIDKYIEINGIAKKAIIDNFSKNGMVNYYFECHFESLEEEKLIEIFGVKDFKKMDLKTVIEKMDYPNLLFGINNGELIASVDYMVSKEYSDEILCVKINEKLNVIDFSHES